MEELQATPPARWPDHVVAVGHDDRGGLEVFGVGMDDRSARQDAAWVFYNERIPERPLVTARVTLDQHEKVNDGAVDAIRLGVLLTEAQIASVARADERNITPARLRAEIEACARSYRPYDERRR